MSNKVGQGGGGAGGAKDYFTEGRGPGRGMDIEREAPKEHRRGVGDGDPIAIDLEDLHKPGRGPVNFDKMNGKRLPAIEVGGIALHGSEEAETGG